MKSFEFREHTIELEICGEIYNADVSTETFDYYNEKVKPGLQKIAEDAEDKPTITELCQSIRAFIDVVLGKGTAKKLLNGRKHQYNDLIDLGRFIMEALKEYEEKTFPLTAKTTDISQS